MGSQGGKSGASYCGGELLWFIEEKGEARAPPDTRLGPMRLPTYGNKWEMLRNGSGWLPP